MDTISRLISDALPLQRIGAGFCGSVWSKDGSSVVIKREDGGPGRSLRHEYEIHQRVMQALKSIGHDSILTLSDISFNIPSCRGFLESAEENTWSQILPYLPPESSACNALLSDKIMPMPRPARQVLVEKYAPGTGSLDVFLDDPKNDHCLIRPYLGRRKHTSTTDTRARRPSFFSLRNFPLHIDRMEDLGLSATLDAYAKSMADALAFLHWIAKVDANDVEFVLASPSSSPHPKQTSTIFQSETLGPHSMWILDFDCCREMSMDEQGVDVAVKSFWRNDPYYPRPGSENAEDQRLWGVFRERFLEVSQWLLWDEEEAVRVLPGLLMERIVESKGMFLRGPVF